MPSRVQMLSLALVAIAYGSTAARSEVPGSIAVNGTVVATLSAQGAQIYECKTGNDGKLAWTFREPIAVLIADGRTVGRHYAGPTWESVDGSVITGKVTASIAGPTPADIAWLRLSIVGHRGAGVLAGVTSVQRIDTHGGTAQGPCEAAGAFLAAPYSATYVFLHEGS